MSRLLKPAHKSLPSNAESLNKNDFKLLSNLGEGSFGKVYKVQHLPTGDLYAVKVVSKERLRNNTMMKQIQNEIEIMEAIDHPFIVKLITYFENEANIYLVLELGGVIYSSKISQICMRLFTKKNVFQKPKRQR